MLARKKKKGQKTQKKMGAGCCKLDSNSVVSPNHGNNNKNNSGGESPARFSNLQHLSNTNQNHNQNLNSVQTTSLTVGSSSGMNTSSTTSFVDASSSSSQTLKDAMRFAKPCSDYFRGLEGIFYCIGDQDCPVLQSNPSEEIWGGAPPSKQMLSLCEKEIAYIDDQHQNNNNNKINGSHNVVEDRVILVEDRVILQQGSTPVRLQEIMDFPQNAGDKQQQQQKVHNSAENDDNDDESDKDILQTLSPRNSDNNITDSGDEKKASLSLSAEKQQEQEQNNQRQHLKQFHLQQQQHFASLKKKKPDPVESKIYTADSSPCRCARHAGIIGRSGGVFIVINRPGETSYTGSVRNGCVSHSHGAYDLSIEICSLQFPK